MTCLWSDNKLRSLVLLSSNQILHHYLSLQANNPRLNFKDKYTESYRNSHPNAPLIVPWMAGVVSAWTCFFTSLQQTWPIHRWHGDKFWYCSTSYELLTAIRACRNSPFTVVSWFPFLWLFCYFEQAAVFIIIRLIVMLERSRNGTCKALNGCNHS